MQNSNLGQPLPEISTEISTEISKVSQSVIEQPRNKKEPIGQTDRQTQKENMNLICKGLEEQLQLDYVKEAYPLDLNIIEDIKLNIFDMYFSDYTI